MKFFTFILLALSVSATVLAQKKSDILRSNEPITWLGLDFSQTRFIGTAAQFGGAGEAGVAEMRNKYIPAWNDLFLNEPKKYDVPRYTRRESVPFALNVTQKSNAGIGEDFFSQNPADYSRLTADDITRIVKGYDFMGNKGVGLIFFVEGMSKGREEASAWITFVDMGRKTVLQTYRVTGSGGGFGLRNYWAKAFLGILKEAGSR